MSDDNYNNNTSAGNHSCCETAAPSSSPPVRPVTSAPLSSTWRGALSSVFSLINWQSRYLVERFPTTLGRLFLKMPPDLPPLAPFERLSPLVCRIMGLNPSSHTLQGTNTYLIGTGKARILIDTGEGLAEYEPLLKEALTQAGAETIQAVLLTHRHYDHVGGLESVMKVVGCQVPAYKRTDLDDTFSRSNGRLEQIEDGQIFSCEGARLRAIYTPGHTEDHVAFWLEEEQALFSGDCVLGCGTTVFDELYSYMQSLHKLLDLCKGKMKVLYPGHGQVIEGEQPWQVLEMYIQHREERERQIVGALQEAHPQGLTSLDIVERVYEDIPLSVKFSAQFNVEHHLDKLNKEGVIKKASRGTWVALTPS